jgi:serine/threonine protein kinase
MTKDREAETVAEGQTAVDEEVAVSLRHTSEGGERYVTVGELGRGGMGEVTLCLDRRIGRRVALKRTRPGANAERFVREACVQGQLQHPTVVPLYDMSSDGGRTSFTMKHVRGMTFKAILAGLAAGDPAIGGRFSQRKLLSDFASVCLGVAFAHDRGVVHRDLKPENLMAGDYGEVYVLDWGVAKIADAAALADDRVELTADAHATAAGSMIGTPGYMSPEQCVGETENLDGRSDVYSLGAILFEILALERLHEGKTVEERVESTLQGADARASVRAPDRDVAPELEAVCVRATAKDRAARFASARELHDAVERYLNHDRDVELRRTMAASHAREAARAKDRRRALSEAGRALALDPANAEAQNVLLRLLTEPPAETPPEARAQLERSFDAMRREVARTSVGAILPFGLFLPPLLLMGVRQWASFATMFAGIALFLVACWFGARSERPGNRFPLLIGFVTAAVNTLAATIFGPLIAAPSLTILATVTLVSQVDRHRWLVVLLGVFPILAPFAAARLGVLPRSYAFSGGTIHVLPFMVGFPETWSLVLLVAMNLVALSAATMLAARLRDNLAEAERKLVVQTWQLKHLLPESTAIDPAA